MVMGNNCRMFSTLTALSPSSLMIADAVRRVVYMQLLSIENRAHVQASANAEEAQSNVRYTRVSHYNSSSEFIGLPLGVCFKLEISLCTSSGAEG